MNFEVKNNQTFTQTKINGSMHKRTAVEEHIKLLITQIFIY